MKKIRWGIISTADIGVAKVIPGMLKSSELEVAAISSRKLATAKAWAAKLGIPKAYGSYEEMLADPEIDAVYNPLPNHLHVPLTLAAAKAGKHVLCEKPIAITAKEAAKLRKIPKKILVAEAFMVRHALQWIEARHRVKAGDIGEVRAIQVMFSYFNRDPANVRNMADIGGGGLLDIGCYPITVCTLHLRGRADAGGCNHRPRSQVQDRPPDGRAGRFRQGPSPQLHGLNPACALPAGADHGHQGPHRSGDSLQCPTRQAQPHISCRAWT